MYVASFSTFRGTQSLPIDRATVLEGMRRHGYDGGLAIRAMNNLSRGLSVMIGECLIRQTKSR